MNNKPITEFGGEFRFLSNFWSSPITYEGFRFATVEHAYQAAKNPSIENLMLFSTRIDSAGAAKSVGRTTRIRSDWAEVKTEIMHDLLRRKFEIPELRELLLATGNRLLQEGNHWGDNYWGICPPVTGPGINMLGQLLMAVRSEIAGQ